MNAPLPASLARPVPARIAAFGLAEALAHATDWRDLARRGRDRNPFWEPEFALPAASLPGVRPPLFVAAWRGERMTALIILAQPGMGRLAPVLRGWRHEQAVLGTPLLDPDCGPEDLGRLLEWLRGAFPLAAAMLLPWMGESDWAATQVAAVAPSRPVRLDPHERAALVTDAAGPPISARRRKEFGRQRRRLAERGILESVSAATPEALETGCEAFALLEARGWKGRRGDAFAQDPARSRFLRAAMREFARHGDCRIDLLTLDGAPIAAAIVLGGAQRALYWKTTYDEAFAAYSPGVLLTLDVTARQLGEPSARMTDSCAVADHPMIDRIWPGRIAISDWWIPLRPASPMLLAAERARRALRRAAKAALARARA